MLEVQHGSRVQKLVCFLKCACELESFPLCSSLSVYTIELIARCIV